LAAALLEDKEQVVVVDDFSRPGSAANLDWLRGLGDVRFVHGDVRLATDLESIFKCESIECVFHLAGQVAMTTSLASPRRDFEVNVLGSMNVLELVRAYSPEATVVYASSNKVYGELEDIPLREAATRYQPTDGSKGVSESARLDFRTPYGCSKGSADQYMLDYARNFGVRSVVFRHSTIYGGRQRCTFDQGWVGWFCKQALLAAENSEHRFTINGDGKQVRDLLYVTDAVRCYRAAHKQIAKAAGQVFNIGGGWENSMSLVELLSHLQTVLGVKLNFDSLPWRNNDQKYFVADIGKAKQMLGWSPVVSKEEGIAITLDWERQ
jgi:CDP-paratose 2-epimerase